MKKLMFAFSILTSLTSYSNDLRGNYFLVDEKVTGRIDYDYYISCPENIEVKLKNDNLDFSHPEQELFILGNTSNGIVLHISNSFKNRKIEENKATKKVSYLNLVDKITGDTNTIVELDSSKNFLTIKRSAFIRFVSTCNYKRL